MRKCKHCGSELPQQLRGRPREVCDACKPRRVAVLTAVADKAPAAAHAADADSPLVEQVRAQLTEAGRLDTVEGQAAVLLARKAESRLTNASQAAAAVRELRAAMAAALQGAQAGDKVDELADKRRRAAGQ